MEKSLEAERHRRTGYLETYATYLDFPVEAFKAAEQGRLAYALAGLRTGTILNGGALVAVPAFTSLIGIKIQTQPALFLTTIVLYLLGLVLAAASRVIAYRAAVHWSEFYNHMRARIEATIHLNWYPPDNEPEIKARQKYIENMQAAQYDFQKRSGSQAHCAFYLALAGLLLFIFGCLILAYMLFSIQTG